MFSFLQSNNARGAVLTPGSNNSMAVNAQAQLFQASLMRGLNEDQQRIRESGIERMSLNHSSVDLEGRTEDTELFSSEKASVENEDDSPVVQGAVEDDDESPVVPRRMYKYPSAEAERDMLQDSDEEEQFVLPTGMSQCEAIFKKHNNSIPHLLAMCIGMTDALADDVDRILPGDFDTDPLYKEHLEKSLLPKVPLLKEEVRRRADIRKEKVRCSNWSRPKLMDWLKAHPDMDKANDVFLKKAEAELYNALKASAEESAALKKDKLADSNWNCMKPWLRLYLCTIEDDALEAVKVKHDCDDRDVLDAGRNHDEAPMTFEEIVAELYNDDTFIPITESLPDLHYDFSEPIALPFDEMPGGKITPEQVKSRMAEARAKLLQVSTMVARERY
jgi:hypothetical protein